MVVISDLGKIPEDDAVNVVKPSHPEFPKLKKELPHVELERHPTNLKKSKSEKSKSILFIFSIFSTFKKMPFYFSGFRLFEIENGSVPLFDFSNFRHLQ